MDTAEGLAAPEDAAVPVAPRRYCARPGGAIAARADRLGRP